jgi:hypothetical protein
MLWLLWFLVIPVLAGWWALFALGRAAARPTPQLPVPSEPELLAEISRDRLPAGDKGEVEPSPHSRDTLRQRLPAAERGYLGLKSRLGKSRLLHLGRPYSASQ